MPPTPIIAKLVTNNEDCRERLVHSRQGWEGERTYLVNTDDATLAHFAGGLPQIGDAWGSEIPELTVWTVGEFTRAGGLPVGDGSGGWGWMKVSFRTPVAAVFSHLPANVNEQWTEINVSRTQEMLRLPKQRLFIPGIGLPIPPPLTAIDNGRGVPIDIGAIEAKVVRFIKKTDAPDLPKLLSMCRPTKVNADPIQMPPLYGASTRIHVDKRQARFMTFDLALVGNFIQISMVLELAENFLFKWYTEDAKGHPTDNAVIDRIYDDADFSGLWR